VEYEKEVMNEIEEINDIFDKFCSKISEEHHKGRDGVWNIEFDRWSKTYYIYHEGYWCDSVYVEKEDLLEGLKRFKRKIKAKIDKEISEYDFEHHCAKEL